MKTLTTFMATMVVLGLASLATAQDAGDRPRGVMGTLVKVDGKDLVVNAVRRGGEAEEVRVTTDENTTFNVNGASAKLEDLQPRMQVTVRSRPGSDAEGARTTVTALSPGVSGSVVRVSDKNVILSVRQRGQDPREVTVVTDANTKVIFAGRGPRGDQPAQEPREGTLSELEEGMRVHAIPETGTATRLIVRPAFRRGGGGGQDNQTI